MIGFKDELTESIPAMHEESFSAAGIHSYHGLVTFFDVNEVSVNDKKISARKILIASGSQPRKLGIPGEQFLRTSDDLLNQNASPPPHILFIGAGYISMEFSHILAAVGSKITILEYAPSPLAAFDQDLVSMLLQESQKAGIDIKVNIKVVKIECADNRFRIHSAADKEEVFEADLVVHGAGRVPNVERLKLEMADIAHEEYRIKVNEYLQSESNGSIYVAGDAHAAGIHLTPVAEMEGKVAAHNMLHGNSTVPDYLAVPSVVFSYPQLGMVGDPATPSSNVNIVFQDTSRKHINRRLGMSVSAFKIVTDKTTGQIRGVHMLGYNIDEVINMFAEAIRSGKTVNDLKDIPWTFPSVTYDTIYRL